MPDRLSSRSLNPSNRPVRADHSAGSAGFTLLELMIVVGIVGILSAVALPQYRRTMAVAEASTSILEALSFAEQCSIAHKTGLSVRIAPPGGPVSNCNNINAVLINTRRWSGDASGVLCLGLPASSNHRQARLRVSARFSPIFGTITCTFHN